MAIYKHDRGVELGSCEKKTSEFKTIVHAELVPESPIAEVEISPLVGVYQSSKSVLLFSLLGGVDNCVKLWNARSICNPDDDDEGGDAK